MPRYWNWMDPMTARALEYTRVPQDLEGVQRYFAGTPLHRNQVPDAWLCSPEMIILLKSTHEVTWLMGWSYGSVGSRKDEFYIMAPIGIVIPASPAQVI